MYPDGAICFAKDSEESPPKSDEVRRLAHIELMRDERTSLLRRGQLSIPLRRRGTEGPQLFWCHGEVLNPLHPISEVAGNDGTLVVATAS